MSQELSRSNFLHKNSKNLVKNVLPRKFFFVRKTKRYKSVLKKKNTLHCFMVSYKEPKKKKLQSKRAEYRKHDFSEKPLRVDTFYHKITPF